MARKIYFYSLKGGVGATTCAVGVGMALARAGERTLILDGDKNYPAALTAAGCAGRQAYTLEEARRGACRVKQAIVEHPRLPNLFILPCAGCAEARFAESAAGEVENLFDMIICDGAAASACAEAAVICEPYPAGIRAADIALAALRDGQFKEPALIINKVNGGLVYDGRIMPPKDIADLLHAPLWGVVPEDLTMPLGGMRAESVKAFKLTAARIAGGGTKIYRAVRGYGGAGGFIKRKMRYRI